MVAEDIITAMIGTLLSALGYVITRWINSLIKQLDEHEVLLDDLTQEVANVKREMVTKTQLTKYLRRKIILDARDYEQHKSNVSAIRTQRPHG